MRRARNRRVLVWARHTRRWEAAHQEGDFWIRDDESTICKIGEEVANHPLPAPPQQAPQTLDELLKDEPTRPNN